DDDAAKSKQLYPPYLIPYPPFPGNTVDNKAIPDVRANGVFSELDKRSDVLTFGPEQVTEVLGSASRDALDDSKFDIIQGPLVELDFSNFNARYPFYRPYSIRQTTCTPNANATWICLVPHCRYNTPNNPTSPPSNTFPVLSNCKSILLHSVGCGNELYVPSFLDYQHSQKQAGGGAGEKACGTVDAIVKNAVVLKMRLQDPARFPRNIFRPYSHEDSDEEAEDDASRYFAGGLRAKRTGWNATMFVHSKEQTAEGQALNGTVGGFPSVTQRDMDSPLIGPWNIGMIFLYVLLAALAATMLMYIITCCLRSRRRRARAQLEENMQIHERPNLPLRNSDLSLLPLRVYSKTTPKLYPAVVRAQANNEFTPQPLHPIQTSTNLIAIPNPTITTNPFTPPAPARPPSYTTLPRPSTDEEPCTICLESFESGDITRQLPCGHFFHPGCIDPWLKISPLCPTCRINAARALGEMHPRVNMEEATERNAASPAMSVESHCPASPSTSLEGEAGFDVGLWRRYVASRRRRRREETRDREELVDLPRTAI
ncbi:cytochrome c oxidase subunit 1, partial [Chytridiales sp. JEL 0842]